MKEPRNFAGWAKLAQNPPGTKLEWPKANLRNVVVTVATGYPANMLKPLVHSLREVSKAPLVIVANADNDLADEFSGQDIIIYPVSESSGYRPYPALQRLAFYFDILSTLPKQTRRLLLVDSRDVVFQADPFRGLKDVELEFFAENDDTESWTTETTNGRWARAMLNRKQRGSLQGKPIVNGGVIAGTPDGIKKMCQAKIEIALRTCEWTKHTTGLDNISTNVVAHSVSVPGSVVTQNHTHVANIYRDTNMRTDAAGKISLAEGKPCPIVHMYDRLEQLKKFVNDRYKVAEDPGLTLNKNRSMVRQRHFENLLHFAMLARKQILRR